MFNKRLWELAPGAKSFVVQSVVFKWIGLLANIVLFITIGFALQSIFDGQATNLGAHHLLIILAAVLVRAVSSVLAQNAGDRAAQVAKEQVRSAVYGKLLRLGQSYGGHVSTAEAVQMSIEGADQLQVYFGQFLPQLFYAVVAPITLFIAVAPLCLPAAVVLLVCVPFIPGLIMLVRRSANAAADVYWGSYTDLGALFLEDIQGLTTLKVFQADAARHARMNEKAEKFRNATMSMLGVQLRSILAMDLVVFGGAAIGVIVAVFQLAAGAVPFASAFAVVFLSQEFFLPMRTLGSMFHAAMNGMAASKRMLELIDVEESPPGTLSPDPRACAIRCRGVGFSYDGSRQALQDIDATFEQGSFTGIVGPSGAGKSTLASILAGTVADYQGTVSVGGVDVRDIDSDQLACMVTTVPTNGYLFKGTVRSNLQMAAPQATDEDMWRALQRCRIHEFVETQGGLDMPVAEGGGNLSGGQRQRICIARALLHNTPVYIFDEATSNIDVESERAIGQVILELAQAHTVICISHRLSLVRNADGIFVLDGGTVAETGTHEQLVAADGVYARLCSSQQRLERLADIYDAADEEQTGENLPAADIIQTDGSVRPQDNPANAKTNQQLHRSGFAIMKDMLGLLGNLRPHMVLAIVLGVIGFLAGIFLTTFGAYGLMAASARSAGIALVASVVLVGICGLVRGPLRYGEQLTNHFIAFKLLATIRDYIYGALRRLAPAKLEGRDKGDLVSLVTSDIELLEVFYAHTISPVAIAVLVSFAMFVFFAVHSIKLALLALLAYAVIGIVLPLVGSRASGSAGQKLREGAGELNSLVLESLRGLRELLQYGQASAQAELVFSETKSLGTVDLKLKFSSALLAAAADVIIIGFDILMIWVAFNLASAGEITQATAFVCSAAFMSSFGAVVAIMRLGTSLQPTLASGQRVLDLLQERPQTNKVVDGIDVDFAGAAAHEVSFAYAGVPVLEQVNLPIAPGSVVSLEGPSGSGKSTLLKLFMRFWDADAGSVQVSGTDVRQVNTACLRSLEGYMTQDTHLFDGTVAENILLARLDATQEQLRQACQRAQILDVVEALPEGFDTQVGELGDTLSGGERQRIGLARIFLQDAPFILLDEPTSNLDALNEAAVMDALMTTREGKTVLLVSHRASTTQFADVRYTLTPAQAR